MSKKEKNAEVKNRVKLLKKRQPNRSRIGDFFVYLFLFLVALAMVFPLVYAVNSAMIIERLVLNKFLKEEEE